MAVARDPSLVGVANREHSVSAEQTRKYSLNMIIVFPENDAMRAFEKSPARQFCQVGLHTHSSVFACGDRTRKCESGDVQA